VDDDSQTEIDTRGRRAGAKYVVFESATNAQIPSFRVRLETYKDSPVHRVIRYGLQENPWVRPEYTDRLKSLMSSRDYREKILAEDVPPDLLVYSRFAYAGNVMPCPAREDITEQVVEERYGREGVRYVIGQDFGVLVTASVFLKAYPGKRYGEINWWAVDEITSYATTSDLHARKILERYAPEDVIVIADPHFNTKDADKSDYNMFKREGLDIHPSVHGQIGRKHRESMLNAMLEDSKGVRRFFVDCDARRRPKCQKLVQAFLSQQYDEKGNSEPRKDYRDVSHWPAAVSYGVFPWERIRGTGALKILPGGIG
jgi:hypothetical protein